MLAGASLDGISGPRRTSTGASSSIRCRIEGKWRHMTQAIASVVTAVGVIFAGISLRGSQLQRNRQFEALYIQRYWSLIDRLSPKAALQGVCSVTDRHTATLYLQLCEDQIEMYMRGWVTHRTFHEWSEGMRASLQAQPIKGVWRDIQSHTKHPDGLELPYAYLRQFNRPGGLPKREVGPLRRWLRGV